MLNMQKRETPVAGVVRFLEIDEETPSTAPMTPTAPLSDDGRRTTTDSSKHHQLVHQTPAAAAILPLHHHHQFYETSSNKTNKDKISNSSRSSNNSKTNGAAANHHLSPPPNPHRDHHQPARVTEEYTRTTTAAAAGTTTASSLRQQQKRRTMMMAFLIVLIGGCAAIAFLFVGIRGVQNDQNARFDRHVIRVVGSIRSTFAKYETAGLFVHQACRHRDISRPRFRELYENILSTGLEIQATSFNPNISHAERLAVENEARQFYQQYYPTVNYTGIKGLEPTTTTAGSSSTNLTVQPRSIQTFYFPVHYIEPVQGNEGAIDFDLYSSISRRATIQQIMENWRPAVVRAIVDASFYTIPCMQSWMHAQLSLVVVIGVVSSMVLLS
jgi:hypothetical protein